MVREHYRLNGHAFEQSPGDSEGQRGLVCCSPWGCKELDMTEGLSTAINIFIYVTHSSLVLIYLNIE